MTRVANFFISKNLSKTDKMPNHRQWKVSENDRCVEGPVLLYLRSKGWLIDRVCQPAVRHCVLTKRGFLLIYMKDEKGFVLDMRRAFEIKTISGDVTAKNGKYRRCRVKIRYTFGTVNIILTNAKIEKWRDHLLNATNSPAAPSATPYLPHLVSLSLPRRGPDYVVVPPVSLCGPHDGEGYGSCAALRSIIGQSETQDRESSDASVATALDVSTDDDEYQCLPSSPMVDEDTRMSPVDFSSTTTSEVEQKTVIEAPPKPLFVLTTLCKVPVSRKQVKYSEKQSVPAKTSDSSNDDNEGFNSFQFWRASIFESDV